eukprot:TRINITY_DN64771_c0_g1_i1.p1 TRINITY_DN64771_c0_g1~~TRINITY_DN64771_c0_g1_i1.p1  ORF type:complete len:681 (-),score=212.63 TRINITY_DN64771_c0_g1_i1:100-2142(-)
MMSVRKLCLLAALYKASANDASTSAGPVAKVVELLDGMTTKIKAEGESASKTFAEAKNLCEKRTSDLKYAIKTGGSDKDDAEARISKAQSKIALLGDTIEESHTSIEGSDADLTGATEVRKKEKADFSSSEKELIDSMSALEKAILTLQKASTGNPASLLQVQKAPNLIKAVEAMVSASMITAQDGAGLTALLQKAQSDDSEFQAPAYEKKGGSVLDMIEDLYDKAKDQLATLRKKETDATHNFELLSQSLNNEIALGKKAVEKAQQGQKEEGANLAESQRDLNQIQTSLTSDSSDLKDLTLDCKHKEEEFNEESKDREDELKAIAAAKEALGGATGAAAQAYSLLQLDENLKHRVETGFKIQTKADLTHVEVVHLIRKLADESHDQQLSMLAEKIGAAMRSDKSGSPFDTIIKMIEDMVANMEKSLQEDTTKKQYCDTERAKASDKKESKQDEVDKLSSKMDSAVSKSASLKSEVSELQKALSSLAVSSSQMTKIRSEEKAAYAKNFPEMQEGLTGVKQAMKILRGYYEGTGKRGGATGVLGMLEVCEGDFAKSLSHMRMAENSAADEFEKQQQEMKMEKSRKEQDIKYKTQSAQRLDKALLDLKSDSDSVGEEMSAIIEYSKGIESECTETQESFAEKAEKRQHEIDGLKNALEMLKFDGTSLLQKKFLRGAQAKLSF